MGPSEGELPGREIKICQNFCKPSPITVICPSDITFTAWEPRRDIFLLAAVVIACVHLLFTPQESGTDVHRLR